MASTESWEFAPYTRTIHRAVYPAIDPTNAANSARGKVVLVTGGATGIGKGIAGAFVAAGAKAVALVGRRAERLAGAKAELEEAAKTAAAKAGGDAAKILTFAADVVDEAAMTEAFAATAREAGPVDVAVANAAYFVGGAPLLADDLDDWWRGFEVNVKGTAVTFRAWAPHRAARDATFIAVGSGAAHVLLPGMSSYGVSKMGQAHLVSTLQAENPDIRVMSFHPGSLETEMNAKGGRNFSRDEMSLPSGFAVWLASPAAYWVGGLFLWAHWDVEELGEMKEQIVAKKELKMGLIGYPKDVQATVVR